MEKRGEAKGQGRYLRASVFGLLGAALFFGLLLAAAGLGDRYGAVMDLRKPIAKGCLLASAIVCALLAGRRAGQRKLVHALCAEGVLLIILMICAMAMRSDVSLLSIAVDLLLLLFGAFAGTMLQGKQRIKQRGKR